MNNYELYDVQLSSDFRELLKHAKEKYSGRDLFREKVKNGLCATSAEEFERMAFDLGAAFGELGLLDGKIGVVGETSVAWFATYFATVCGGGVIVPIDKELPTDEIANILRDSGCAALVCSKTMADVAREIKPELPTVRHWICMKEADGFELLGDLIKRGAELGHVAYLSRAVDAGALSALLYTSGTTGKSKGVMLSQRNILAGAYGGAQNFWVGTVMSVLPVHHSYEFTCGIIMQMVQGVTICICEGPRYFLQNLQFFKPESVYLVPAYVEMIYKKIWANATAQGTDKQLRERMEKSNREREQGKDNRADYFKSIKDALGGRLMHIICGGAPLSAFYAKEFRDMGILLLQGYGITECSPLVAVNRNEYHRDGTVGLPIPTNDVKILEEDEDGDGEVWVRGDNVMLGYFNNPDATAEVLRDGWFCTGDIGRLDEDGFLTITGRKKNLVVLSNGKNVYPEEIEDYLYRIPFIKEVVVFGEMQDGVETRLVAEVFVDEAYSAKHTREQLQNELEKRIDDVNKTLPGFKQVHSFKLRDTEFEKTTKKSIKRFVKPANC